LNDIPISLNMNPSFTFIKKKRLENFEHLLLIYEQHPLVMNLY
jgi:hypothetical protein